jgi:hypothetical protein
MNWDEKYTDEWNKLGFYYEYEDYIKQWRIFGSKTGIQKFCEILESYATDVDNLPVSEHIHLGPHSYLKIMTWHERLISENAIAGTLDDLLVLSKMIREKLNTYGAGEVMKVFKEYAEASTSSLLFIIMPDNFRPSSIEFCDES